MLAKQRVPAKVIAALDEYDYATAIQAASLLHRESGMAPSELLELSKNAAPAVTDGFAAYLKAWQETERARVE